MPAPAPEPNRPNGDRDRRPRPSFSRVTVWAMRTLRFLGRSVRMVAQALLALVIVFEEWGWRPLAAALGRLARLAPIARLEALIQRLPPYAALAVFVVPSAALFPLKLLALWLIAQGKTLAAAALFIGAKVAGTAIVARLFMLTQGQLMRIGWFKRLYDVFMPWKEALTTWARQSSAWRMGRLVKARLKARYGPVVKAWRSAAILLARDLLARLRAALGRPR